MPTSRRLSRVAIFSAIIALTIILDRCQLPEDAKTLLLALLEKLRETLSLVF